MKTIQNTGTGEVLRKADNIAHKLVTDKSVGCAKWVYVPKSVYKQIKEWEKIKGDKK